MNLHAGDFLSLEMRNITLASPKQALVATDFLLRLYRSLAEDTEAVQLLKSGERGLLRDLENVLLRYDQPEKWRAFAQATLTRKGEDAGIAKGFKRLAKKDGWIAPLSATDNTLPADHPVGKAMRAAHEVIWRKVIQGDQLDDEVAAGWQRFLDILKQATATAAVREWLCLSLRRVFDERPG